MGTLDPRITIIVPIRNGSSRIPILIRSLSELTGFSADLILVDDGSTDNSWATIRRFSESDRSSPLIIRGIRLDRGRGQQSAILAGLTAADTRRVVTMDDDLSHPLDALPELISALDNGYDLVYANPPERPGSISRRIVSRLHQYHMSLITGSSFSIRVGSYRSLTSDLIYRILREPFLFPYISAQCLVLRPPPAVAMLETSRWKRGSQSGFSLLSLLKLEFRLARYFGPLRKSGILNNRTENSGDAAGKWIAEVCGS